MTAQPHFLLRGIAGSTAHGLATENSDEDLHGVFSWPTEDFLDLSTPPESITGHDPQDYSYHELKKFLKLALKANPTVLELLWLDEYLDVDNAWGGDLIYHRKEFLSSRSVYNAYGGYAHDQFKKLERRALHGEASFSSDTRNRTAKHARHLFRLLEQGSDLLTKGTFSIKVKNPQFYFDLMEMTPEQWSELYKVAATEFERSYKFSLLPDEPNMEWASSWLRDYREEH